MTLTECNQLTHRQAQIMAWISQRFMERRLPSIREVMSQFGFASPNGAICHLKALSKKGYIIRGYQRAKAIFVLKLILPIHGGGVLIVDRPQ